MRKSTRLILFVGTTLCLFAFNNCGKFQTAGKNSAFTNVMAAGDGFTCQPSAEPVPDTALRLTGMQFQNTLFDEIISGLQYYGGFNNFYYGPVGQTIFQSFPPEGAYDRGNALVYDTQDQRITMVLLQAQVALAQGYAELVVTDPNFLSQFVIRYAGAACTGTIPNQGATKACYDAFISGFGLRALHRPLETANNPIDAASSNPAAGNDLAFYESVYTDPTNGGFDTLIATMLLSPDSVFMLPIHGTGTTTIKMTNYEVAMKLAIYYTDRAPDDALMAAAAAGFVGPGNTISEQADRLFKTTSARTRFLNFFTQWIRPAAVPQLIATSNSPSMDAGTLSALRQNAIQEMIDLTEYYTFGAPKGRLADIITSDVSFAKTADVADIYGVAPWPGKNADGSYDETNFVHFPGDHPRAGLFTRAAYAFSGARDNNLIIRGARIRKDYFCETLSPPANFALSTDIEMDGDPTVRNIVAANTEQKGSACITCHQHLINPLGFALENYDSFGRYRTTEPIFNADGTVKQLDPVNATSQPFVTNGDNVTINDPVTFSQDLSENHEFNSCFVRHYFRYSEARSEDNVSDSCQMSAMLSALQDPTDGSLQGMIKSVVMMPNFQTRFIEP